MSTFILMEKTGKKSSRIITISVKLALPEILTYEVKTVTIAIYTHDIQCLGRCPGLRQQKTLSLRKDDHCCMAMLPAPTEERCYIHTSAYIIDPIPLVCPGSWQESRFMGYQIHDIGAGKDDLSIEMTLHNFHRFNLYRSSVNF